MPHRDPQSMPRQKRCRQRRRRHRAAPWARLANFVKKPPLVVNVTYLKLNAFNASMWVSWSLSNPKKSQCIDQFIQIHQICVNKHKYENHIKFEVSLHFWPIWPTVGQSPLERSRPYFFQLIHPWVEDTFYWLDKAEELQLNHIPIPSLRNFVDKKLEIKQTESTIVLLTLKTDITTVGLVFLISNSFWKKNLTWNNLGLVQIPGNMIEILWEV